MTDAIAFGGEPAKRSGNAATVPAVDLPRGFLGWLLKSRTGFLTIWAVIAFVSLDAVVFWHAFRAPVLESYAAKMLFLAATTFLWLPLLLFFMDAQDNLSKGPRMTLPLLCLGILSVVTALALWDWASSHHRLGVTGSVDADSTATRVALLAFLALAFIPLVWNAINFARYEAIRRKDRERLEREQEEAVQERREAESMGALVATFSVLGIGLLAWAAGGNGSSLRIEHTYELILGGIVIGVFFVVVFLDTLSDMPAIRALGHTARTVSSESHWLASFYNWVDAGFVRIGASIIGMNHVSVWSRYGLLSATLACLCLLGWYLPPPLGIVPCFFAFGLALSVSRLWSWVEDDRSLAAMTQYKPTSPYRVGFREDFKDETLLGFIFVFALIPITMMQANDGQLFGPELFKHAEHQSFAEWFGFFGVELAKAVPIVDWSEVYGVSTNDDTIAMNGVASKHAVFLARVMIDLLLLASLLQAVGITTRNRQQKQLYSARYIDMLDPFVEKVELMRAIRIAWNAEKQTFDLTPRRTGDLVDFRRYNEDRLREIYGSTSDAKTRGFIEGIAQARGVPLASAIDLTIEIAEGHKNEVDLVRAFNRAEIEHKSNLNLFTADDLYRVLSALRHVTGLRDFKRVVMEGTLLLAEDTASIEYLFGIAGGDKADSFLYARDTAAEVIMKLADRTRDRALLEDTLRQFKALLTETVAPRERVTRSAIAALEAWLRTL